MASCKSIRPGSSGLRMLVVFLFMHFSAKSQAVFGINGGVNQANFIQVQWSYLNPEGSYNACQGGLFFKSASSKKHWRMGAELNYRRKSDQLGVFNSNGMAGANLLDGHFRLDYASLLLLPELRFGKKLEWFLNGGLYFSHLVQSSFWGDDISYAVVFYHPPRYHVQEDPASYFPQNELGAVATTGISYAYTENWQISLGLRYFRTAPLSNYQSQDFGALLSISHTFQGMPLLAEHGWLRKLSDRLEH